MRKCNEKIFEDFFGSTDSNSLEVNKVDFTSSLYKWSFKIYDRTTGNNFHEKYFCENKILVIIAVDFIICIVYINFIFI